MTMQIGRGINVGEINGLFGSLEREESRGEQRGEEESKENDYPPPCLDKISNEEGSNQSFILFGCFKNYDENEKK